MHFIQAEIPALSGLHKTQKTYLLSPHKYRLERYPLQGPNLNRDEWCVKDIQEWAAAVICSWSRSCDCHLPLSPTTTSPSLLTPSFKQAMRTPYLWAHRTGADPRKDTNLYQMTSGHHLKSSRLHDFRTSTSAGDNEHHNHLSLSGLYCSFQQGFAVISPLGKERQL